MRKLAAFGVLMAAIAMPAAAANFSGKWALQGAAGRGGRGGTAIVLNHAGDEVTGTISVRIDGGTNSPVYDQIWGGKVEGDTVSFYVWTGTDQPVRTSYRGTMSASGDEIAFTVTRGRAGAAQQMVARRVK